MVENANLKSDKVVKDLRGLSTDIKPTQNIGTDSTFIELNTGKAFIYSELNTNPITGNGWWEV